MLFGINISIYEVSDPRIAMQVILEWPNLHNCMREKSDLLFHVTLHIDSDEPLDRLRLRG
jgi:hypothetical protein